ncbi:helicase-associated domain-containing protein [Nocardioides lentus]|uniref:Helicase-associated domain-containing protein n=1 Tax=Nocardioides lentus TaxID=338077 RepID=A0ABP5AQ52_9ACTN
MSTEPPSSAGRTLADRLRSWPPERLARLMGERTDLGTPVPADSGQLASRAATRTSLLRALDLLTSAELLVLDALVVLGETSEDDLVATINADPAATRAAAHRLEDLALVWEAPQGLRPLTAVVELVASGAAGPGSGLLPVSVPRTPPADVEAALAGLSPEADRVVRVVDAHGGRGTTQGAGTGGPTDEDGPVAEALRAGVLRVAARERASGTVELPGEYGLALRGGRTTTSPVDVVPALDLGEREQRLVDRTASGAAAESVRLVEAVLEAWGTDPPSVLRSGGLAVRDLRATARDLGTDETVTALLLEVAGSAGLLAQGADRGGDAAWLPTPAYDAWTARTTAQRWSELAAAWLRSSRVPGLVGSRDSAGKAWNALVPELSSSLAVETRRAALAELAAQDEGAVLVEVETLVARVGWLRPRRPRLREDLVRWTLAEATTLGLCALGGIAGPARALLTDGPDAAARALDPLVPPPVEQVLVQADLTAVAPGPLTAEVARDLGLVADVESSGGGGVYRFTPASVRRGLDAGWSRDEVHDFLARVSATGVPQPLSYLVDDVARTHGRVRAGRASAFLRADDEATLGELLALSRTASLGLRRIAPTVLVTDVEIDELVLTLRDLGASPVVEAHDGTVRVVRPDRQRARVPRTRPAGQAGSPGAGAAPGETDAVAERERWEAAAQAVRAGDAAAAQRPAGVAPLSPSGSLAALREALEAGVSVHISYVDSHGASTQRHVRPRKVEGGTLTAWDHRVAAPRTFAVHRITAVARSREDAAPSGS